MKCSQGMATEVRSSVLRSPSEFFMASESGALWPKMLPRLVARSAPVLRARPHVAVLRLQARCFAHPTNTHLMRDNDEIAPSSEKPMYKNEFVMKTPKEYEEEAAKAVRAPVVHDTSELIETSYDLHQFVGQGDLKFAHYDTIREPTFPRKPDLSKGELAAGANLTRTDVWHDPKEPAILSIAKFNPENFRPVGLAENAPMPISTVPEGALDFRANRLPIGHADRRPFVYFMTAASAGDRSFNHPSGCWQADPHAVARQGCLRCRRGGG